MTVGAFITTKDRPSFLQRSLPQVVATGARVLVVDDGSMGAMADLNRQICAKVRPQAPGDVVYLHMGENRGLAAAMNVGLSWWLCDRDVRYISYFQDDVEVDPLLHEVMIGLHRALSGGAMLCLTGHHAREHKSTRDLHLMGIDAMRKASCRATHMFAPRQGWEHILPIRSKGVGFPKRTGPGRGEGSDVDWYITRDHPLPLSVYCVPDLVRTFAWRGEESCWNNTQRSGEDPPLSRAAIEKWLHRSGHV